MNLYLTHYFDGHVHLRDDRPPWSDRDFRLIVRTTAKQCHYAVVMPNTNPKILDISDLYRYYEKISSITRNIYPHFTPLMTIYLNADTSPEDILSIGALGIPFAGFKLYPEGVTTGSDQGVSDFRSLVEQFEAIKDIGGRLLIHCEQPGVDSLRAEQAFINQSLPVIRDFYKGWIAFEHVSTAEGIKTVLADDMMVGSITPHHLTLTHTATHDPHNLCRPILNEASHREQLIKAITTPGQTKFYAGTDSAPHPESAKLSDNPPNGCFSAPTALSLYVDTCHFVREYSSEYVAILDRFLFKNAAEFYGLPTTHWRISSEPFQDARIRITDEISAKPGENYSPIVPFFADRQLRYVTTFL